MSDISVILDEAFETYAEFGPQLRTPRRDRLMQRFPRLSEQPLDNLLSKMEQISSTVWEIAQLGGDVKLGREKIEALLQDQYPSLRGVGLARVVFLVNYYALHEGHDK